MKADEPNRAHYPALDGLRGLAILLVVFYHNFDFINYFFFGWLGVDLFFVLSGFLITDILLKTRDRPNYLRHFYIRRVLRIFPLYYLSLVLFIVLLPAINPTLLDMQYFVNNGIWLCLYLQNWLYIFKPPTHGTALLHFWSLAVEEQYYLLWPFAILLIKKVKALFMLLAILLLLVIATRFIVWTYKIEDLAYFNLFTFSRIDGICLGSMLALLRSWNAGFVKKHTTLIVFILAGINFLFFFFNRSYHFAFPYLAIVGYTTFAILFCILVNEAVSKDNKVIDFIFNLAPLKFFGKISYSLYVFHWPLHLLLFPLILPFVKVNLTDAPVAAPIICSIITTIMGVLASIISYHYFERIFLKLKNNFA